MDQCPLFENNYDPSFFKIEAVIDGRYEQTGNRTLDGLEIIAPEVLKDYSGSRVLVVFYSIYERQLCEKSITK